MKKLTLITTALAAVVLTSPALLANPSTTAQDAILSFRIDDSTGTGASSDLEVDLGNESEFTTTASLSFSQLSAADLSSTFGSNYDTRGDLVFDVAGDINPSDFIATQSGTPASENSSVPQGVGDVAQVANTLSQNASTAHSAQSSVLGTSTSPASGIVGSYTYESLTPQAGQYGYQNFQPTGITGGEIFNTEKVVNGTTTLNLYEYVPVSGRGTTGTPTELGTFTLSSSGALTYEGANATVPEPSTYAMMLSAFGLLFFVLRLRRNGMLE